jgi:hypothetical protein
MDFAEAIRPVFFQTEFEDFLYATHGGTLFVARIRDRLYGVTAKHVLGDFEAKNIFITQEKQATKGSKPAPVKALAYPSSLKGEAVDSDVEDLCVIELEHDTPSDFFKGTEYVIDEKTVVQSEISDRLLVAGVLKEKTRIDPPNFTIGYCRLELGDAGPTSDPFLRRATALFDKPEFTTITGISGSPVFNLSKNALCGMVVRGGMSGTNCEIRYIDIFDIRRLLESVSAGETSSFYMKPRPQR